MSLASDVAELRQEIALARAENEQFFMKLMTVALTLNTGADGDSIAETAFRFRDQAKDLAQMMVNAVDYPVGSYDED